MNIVRISAGLGNQMFQYAFYLSLKNRNADTRIDISEFKYRKHHQGYELERIFNINPSSATEKEVAQIADVSKSLAAAIRRDFFKKSLNVHGKLYKESGFNYVPEVFEMENTYFQGFWQSWKYFENIEAEVRNNFTFVTTLSLRNKKLYEKIEKRNSVSIHIRRGDYTKKRRWDEIGSICNLDYYNWAIAHINEFIENPLFIIFSDDIQWARENLILAESVFVDWNTGTESYNDMRLMSLCKHNIIANSSFSWWGAFLNPNPDKIVIAPGKWYRHTPTPDLVPCGWITLPID